MKNYQQIRCDLCKHNSHVKCCQFTLLNFPFSLVKDNEICDIFNIFTNQANIPYKKIKCGLCHNRFKTHNPYALSNCCSSFDQLEYASLTKKSFRCPQIGNYASFVIFSLPF